MMWLLCLLFPQLISGLGIRLFDSTDGKGSNYNFPPPLGPSCLTLPPHWRNKARSIDSQGACIKIWSGAGCQGQSTLLGPGTPDHGELARIPGYVNWDKNIEALSACTVNLYTEDNYGGYKTQLPLPTSNCLDLNPNFKNKVSSVDIQGSCVRLWYSKGCTTKSHELTSGQYSTLRGVVSMDTRWMNNFEAISDCNTHFFAEGNYHRAETGKKTCLWLPPNKKWTSINSQGKCIKIYSAEACNGDKLELNYDSAILKDLSKWNHQVKSAYVYECNNPWD